MRKLLASLLTICLLSQTSFSQDAPIRPTAIGVSFILNDFTTAQRIRNSSVENVLLEDRWGKVSEMSPGIAVTYFKGLRSHLDFAGTLAFSFTDVSLPNKAPFTSDGVLIEGDASVNLKMLSENYAFTPYLTAGIGASKYRSYWGAFIPVGAGLKLNILDEASIFINTNYRIPVSVETNDYHFVYSIGVSGIIGKKR